MYTQWQVSKVNI